jgi:GntR family transcriptional regulator, transcriptional repressor for pyruvate dehydrogenase complex
MAEPEATLPVSETEDAFSELVSANRTRPAPDTDFGGPVHKRRSISEQVATRILGMIKSGNLRPGDKMPTEAQMSVAFAISRPPLREALKALTIMGVLESRQGGRYTITDLSPSRLVAPFNVMLSVADYDVAEHFECRSVIDLEIIRRCTARATPEMRQRILKLALDGRAFHHDPVAFRLLDYEFHQALNDGAANGMLSTLAQGLYDVGLDVRRVASGEPGVIETSVRQHVEIAEAIAARDQAAAVAAMRRHLEHVRDSTLHSMAAMT